MKPHRPNSQPSQGETLEQQVADWLALRDRGMTPEEEQEFQRWLAKDPNREALCREMDLMWNLFDRVQELPEASRLPDPAVLESRSRRAIRLSLRWVIPVTAAAAAFTFGYLDWWQPNYYSGTTETRMGDIRKSNLPDGSVIDVNTDTRLSVSYSPQDRRLRLERGEAHFTVAKDPKRPFIVEAHGVSITAVGTAFGVRIDSNAIEVLVSAGTVQVTEPKRSLTETPTSKPLSARAGDKVTIAMTQSVQETPVRTAPDAAGIGVIHLTPEEVKRELAWQDRKLQFEEATLGAIAAEFNRYNQQKLLIVDERLAATRFGGTFRSDDPESFVRMLRSNFGVIVNRQSDNTILIGSR